MLPIYPPQGTGSGSGGTGSSIANDPNWSAMGDLAIATGASTGTVLPAPTDTNHVLTLGDSGQLEWGYITIDGGTP